MKERFGGVLAVTLGVVLITTGIHSGSAGIVGGPPPDCGAPIGAAVPVCPTGTINVAELTTPTPVAGDPTLPVGGWRVDITSTCLDPSTSNPVNFTLKVGNDNNATTHPLFVFTNDNQDVSCSYTLKPEAVTGFTSTLAPPSPVTIPFAGGQTNSGVKVNLAETFVRVVPTTPATTPTTAASSPVLAETGPRTRIGASVYFGIALVLLGGVMLFGGTFRRRQGEHS
jgi:hypothetical protein